MSNLTKKDNSRFVLFPIKYPEIWKSHKEEIINMFKLATEWEIKFSSDVIGDKILGMTITSITDYAHFLCDYRLKNIDEEPIYGVNTNPYKHLEKQAGVSDETSNRSNNFEVTSISYKSPEVLKYDGKKYRVAQ